MYISAFSTLLFPVSLLWSRCNLQIDSPASGSCNGHLFVWLTYQSAPHTCIRHASSSLAQACHSFNISAGEVGVDHWHNISCNTAYTILSTVPVNYVVVGHDTSAIAKPHTTSYISLNYWSILLPIFCLNHLCSWHAYRIQLASWLDLGSCDQRINQSNCTLTPVSHLLQ